MLNCVDVSTVYAFTIYIYDDRVSANPSTTTVARIPAAPLDSNKVILRWELGVSSPSIDPEKRIGFAVVQA